ncbi:MAG: adenylate cyclase [Gammaproteobacteria bacterium]|jgi:adenylate cyclase
MATRMTDTPQALGAARSDGAQSTAQLLLDVSNRLAVIDTLEGQLEALIEMTMAATGASRGTLFLNDSEAGELYSLVSHGSVKHEIRILNTTGVAGQVFQTGEALYTNDPYAHPLFDTLVDETTEFTTQNLLCTPIKTMKGEIIGVGQALNKAGGFAEEDLLLFGAMITQASVVLQSTLFVEKMDRARKQEEDFLRVVSDVSSEIQLGPLLQKIMDAITRMLNSERSTLFLNDERTAELYTEIGQGLGASRIRFPNDVGIAGTVFTTRESVNIPYAYADLRFNPEFDRKTDFFTRSILCVPLINKDGKTLGATQILNKRGGPFTRGDEARLRAFTAQISIALENAKLFEDVQNTKNYNESVLESMSNGVITVDENGKIVTCNSAGLNILRTRTEDIIDHCAEVFFASPNAWVWENIVDVDKSQKTDIVMDNELDFGGEKISVNLTVQPLHGSRGEKLGSMLLLEDISSEKRVKSTMSRYMDPTVADKLIESGEELLGGVSSEATALFSDVRGFTTITEELGAQGTVTLLNEYFTVMVDCIQKEGGMLDKFIGDAIMAVFGTPLAHEDDEDRALRAAIGMLTELEAFNRVRILQGKKPIRMGVGINTGNVVSGNIGSPKRMDYTVIGDAVNLAARLESACKQYSAQILTSQFTLDKLRSTYRTREVDLVIVKGKTEPVAVHEVLDYHTPETFPNMRNALAQYEHGLERYRQGSWQPAIQSFEQALALNPADKLCETYIERCRHYEANPPGDDWDRVWTMTSK